jgi:hypothetical protein
MDRDDTPQQAVSTEQKFNSAPQARSSSSDYRWKKKGTTSYEIRSDDDRSRCDDLCRGLLRRLHEFVAHKPDHYDGRARRRDHH